MPTFYSQRPGVDGITDTLAMMRLLVNRAFTHPLIRAQAAHVVEGFQPGRMDVQAAALLAWVHRNVQFVRDPKGVEALHDPVAVALAIRDGRRPFGDCDDLSMYLAALLKSIGFPATFRAVGFMGRTPSHVYVLGPKGMKLDPSRNAWSPAPGELLKETSHMDMVV
jgi:hypothetical protein